MALNKGSNGQHARGGRSGWDNANILMSLTMVSIGLQGEMMDYAVRTSFKSANSWYAYNQLRGTQKAWRQMAILGKDGSTLRNGMNVLGKGVFAIQASVSGYSAISALASDDANKWGVTGKAALDLTIGAISVWGGPVGWVVGGVYVIGDAAGWWGDWGKPAGHP